MRLLILTQKLDSRDGVLGFTHDWVAEFARQCERVIVVALEAGEYDLPGNVKVLSLGKENGRSRLKYVFNFYKYVWQERKNYDTVLVHMNKEYAVMAGWLWRVMGKRVGLWYVHKRTGLALRLAEKSVNVVFTASKESFNLKSRKLKIIGHGINLEKFANRPKEKSSGNFKVIYAGRISAIKNQKLLVKAMEVLKRKGINNIEAELVGDPVYAADKEYKNELISLIENGGLSKAVKFKGTVANKDMAEVYGRADLSVNLCPTGGMDKAVLESMAMGLAVIVYNKTFAPILENPNMMLNDLSAEELADKIEVWSRTPAEEIKTAGLKLKEIIISRFDLKSVANKIIGELEK